MTAREDRLRQFFSTERLYWICQVVGWGLYGILSLSFYLSTPQFDFSWEHGVSIFWLVTMGLGLTHGFRYIAKTWQLTKKKPLQIIRTSVLASVLMGMLLISGNMIIDRLLDISELAKVNSVVILVSLVNSTVLFLFWCTIYFIANYIREARHREIDKIRWEGAMKEFELNKLKSQLNPHFVFNALNTIRSLVEEDPEKAKQSITQLSNILRSSLLADRNKTIALHEEIRTTQDYLFLEKLRYEERLQIDIDIQSTVSSVQVPPMMLQTLVENAVKHGIIKQIHTGFVHLKAYENQGKLWVSIRNSGSLGKLESGGFGLINTRQRLRLLFGDEGEFHIRQAEPGVVETLVIIPFKPSPMSEAISEDLFTYSH